MKKLVATLLFVDIFSTSALSTHLRDNYTVITENAFYVLQKWYNHTSGVWDTCGWWNSANCMTTIAELAAVDSSILSSITGVLDNTYTRAPAANSYYDVIKAAGPGHIKTSYGPPSGKRKQLGNVQGSDFCNACYDDNGWWALAWIAAFDLTLKNSYLELAMQIFTNMTGGGPTNCNSGGIYWCQTNPYVNAITNELYLSVAAHLANRVPLGEKGHYVSIAQSQWSWFKSSGMINSHNLVNDGLTISCANNGMDVWSYNQGVILGALVELDKAVVDYTLMVSANDIAAAAIAALTDANMVLHEVCEPNCGLDATQFKGIFIRNLKTLHMSQPQDIYEKVIYANADSVWPNDRDASTGAFSVSWAGPVIESPNASTQSSGLDALVTALIVGQFVPVIPPIKCFGDWQEHGC